MDEKWKIQGRGCGPHGGKSERNEQRIELFKAKGVCHVRETTVRKTTGKWGTTFPWNPYNASSNPKHIPMS